jgi:hypothetical protein
MVWPARHVTGPQSRPTRLVALVLASVLAGAGCGSTPVPTPAGTVPPEPTTAPATAAQTGDPGPSASAPGQATASPTATTGTQPVPAPGTSEDPPLAPLPEPGLADLFAIGEALYDPGRMGVAVVSLLDQMGIGIYASDGTPIRKGLERAAGDPWLTESEVRGLISMGVEDLESAMESDPDASGGPFTLADLATALKPLLPSVSAGSLAAAFGRAYADHPDDLVPQVMLGQPIDATTPLTRVQLWLLYMDGFVGPAGSSAAREGDVQLAASGLQITWGTARSRLGPIPSFDSTLLPEEWRELHAHLPTLGDTMGFLVFQPTGVHEGHGGAGATATATAIVRRAAPLVSAITGNVILPARTGSLAGIPLTWRSRKPSVLRGHGSLDVALPATTPTDDGGDAQLHYTPRREPANGVGVVARETASLYVTARRRDLVERTYVMAGPILEAALAFQFNSVRTAAGESFPIAWHDDGMKLTLTNTFDVRFDTSPAGISGHAHRKGTTTLDGVLVRQSDGTWRGTFDAGGTDSEIEMDFALPLAGAACSGTDEFAQDLDVVATEQPRGTIDPNQFVLGRGAFDGKDLVLRFYPAGPISTTGADCLTPIEYRGPGPDGRMIYGTYAQFNDARLTDPTLGFLIHTSDSDELEYIDYSRQSAALQIESSWRVVVVPPKP